ncbi:MAG: START domain-containing protein [Adhaeribacter sp.]
MKTAFLIKLLIVIPLWLKLPEQRPAWSLIKQGHGITVYTASAGTTGFKAIKATAVFEGTIGRFREILLDVEGQPDWVYGTARAFTLKKISKQELVYYVETDLPWPASNRDSVVRMKVREDPAKGLLTVVSEGEPQAYPEQDKKVRVPHFSARWEVRNLGENKLGLTYLLQVDPGGTLPAWIVNLFASQGPYESFRKLSGLLHP